MIRMVSTWDKKEYNVAEVSDFLPVMKFAKGFFCIDFQEYCSKSDDVRKVYLAYNFALNLLDALNDCTDVYGTKVRNGKEMIQNFINHVPASKDDVTTECMKSVPDSLDYSTDWDEIEKYFTKEAVYALFNRPILGNEQAAYYVNAWNEAFNTAMQEHTSKAEETVMVLVPKANIKSVKNAPDKAAIKIGLNINSLGLDSNYRTIGHLFVKKDELKDSTSCPKFACVVMNASKMYSISVGNSAKNRRYFEMTGKSVAESNQSYMNARNRKFAQIKESERENKMIQQSMNAEKQTQIAKDIIMLPLGKGGIIPIKNQPDHMKATIGLKSGYGKFGRIYFSAKLLKDSTLNDNVTFLPLGYDMKYPIKIRDYSGKERTVMMTGKEIVDANRAYLNKKCTTKK